MSEEATDKEKSDVSALLDLTLRYVEAYRKLSIAQKECELVREMMLKHIGVSESDLKDNATLKDVLEARKHSLPPE